MVCLQSIAAQTTLVAISFCLLPGCAEKNDQAYVLADNPKIAAAPDSDSVRTTVWECESETLIVQTLEDTAWLYYDDTIYALRHVPAGSGARYESEIALFWSKGGKAAMRIRHKQFDSCRLNNRESAWAAARLYGVDFRGLGQEPGWLLEMYRGDSIVFLADYGTRRIVAPWEQPAIASGGQTVRYTAHSDSNKLAITITRDSCTDIMSGFRFPATVEVILDGKRYAGCGRDL